MESLAVEKKNTFVICGFKIPKQIGKYKQPKQTMFCKQF